MNLYFVRFDYFNMKMELVELNVVKETAVLFKLDGYNGPRYEKHLYKDDLGTIFFKTKKDALKGAIKTSAIGVQDANSELKLRRKFHHKVIKFANGVLKNS